MDFYQWTAVAVMLALVTCTWLLLKAALRRLPPFSLKAPPAVSGAWSPADGSDWRRGLGEGLIAGLAATVLLAIALSALARALSPEAEIRLAPNLLLWLAPAALLAFPLGHAVWRARRAHALGAPRAAALQAAREQHDRLRARPLAWLKGTLAVAGGLAGALLLSDWQLRLTPGQLSWDPLWSLQGRAYAYSDVRAVEALQSRRNWHGDIVREPSYRIRMADGRAWESWRVSHGKTDAELAQAMQLVAQRAGRPLDTLDPYPRGLPAAPRADGERNTAPSS